MNENNLFTLADINEMTASIMTKVAPRRPAKMKYSVAEVSAVIAAAYQIEVAERGATTFHSTPDIEKMLDGIARWLTDPSTKPGLILYAAKPGVGKTTAAKAVRRLSPMLQRLTDESFSEELAALDNRRYTKRLTTEEAEADMARMKEISDFKRAKTDSLPWWRMHTAQDIADFLDCDADDAGIAHDRIFEKVQAGSATNLKSPSLIIDDLGVEPTEIKRFGSSITPLVTLLTDLYEGQQRVIITSNLSDKAIAEKYGPRIADRLKELCEKIAVGGSSFRV